MDSEKQLKHCPDCEVWPSQWCKICGGKLAYVPDYERLDALAKRQNKDRWVNRGIWLAILAILYCFIFARSAYTAEPEAYHLTYTRNGDIQGHGSCFAISKTTVLTARHNCYHDKKPLDCYVIVSGVKYPLTLVKEDVDLDLALCEVTGAILPVSTIQQAAVSDLPIVLAGWPRGEFKSSKGELVREYYQGTAKSLLRVVFDHGLSGAPVSQGDKIIGISISGVPKAGDLDHGKCLFLPAHVILFFLGMKP